MAQQTIRNFCIIAHVDHGKSTLADRFLELTNTVDKRHLMAQTLDSMELEREKGITIKLKAVRMDYNGYQLNLIDTPGHVDFAYEVSRSLAACEGAVLVVDATQGIQAQTVSNIYKAMEAGLTLIPVLNKVDLVNAETEQIARDLQKTFGFAPQDILVVSAKTGQGVPDLLTRIIERVPAPKGSPDQPARALVFDNYYNEHLGVVALIKVVDGAFSAADLASKRRIKFFATGMQPQPEELGILKPHRVKCASLATGEVGYIATGLKDIHKVKVGDTLFWADDLPRPLPGYKEVKPFVFVSIFPVENDKFPQLRDALEKLSLSDSALTFEPESSSALGFGFRCGFLGLLHADIVQERLEREYNLALLSTIPTVEYKVLIRSGETLAIKAASDFPEPTSILRVEEPWIAVTIVTPARYTGGIITLCQNRRAILRKMDYPTESRVVFDYDLPLAELIHNFFDELKTVSSGFASVDYEFLDYRPVDAVKMDVLVHGTSVSPLAQIVLKTQAVDIGQKMLLRLKEVIPRQQFEVALQATLGGKIIAREDIPAMRKNVLAKMSGGHRERKDKLLDIQKKGKARMKRIGKVDIPQEAFRQVLT
jgi:GTP-binding protein LepA